ncbi:MAG: DMT family transporter [Lachnospiraceae bacterium]|nr:DMT family transporter [Lachnospiraceae bacterium]
MNIKHAGYILLAGILWGCMGLFVRPYDAKGLTSWDIVFLRAFLTTVSMAVVLLIYNRKLFRIRLKDIWCFLGTGLFSIVFFNLCYFKEITMTSLSVAAILLYTSPAFVMVISAVCFHEKLTMPKLIALALCFLGLIFVTGVIGDAGRLTTRAILIGLGAGLGYALYSIFGRYALERGYHSFTISFYTFLFAGIGTSLFARPLVIAKTVTADMGNILLALAFVLVSTVIPYIVYTIGLQHVENGKAAIIASIEPVIATLNGILWFHEKPSLGTVLGILLVLGAICLCNVSDKKKEAVTV